jgi:hypothetical protein
LKKLVKDAEDGLVAVRPPEAYVMDLCRRFGFEVSPPPEDILEAMRTVSANIDGASCARLFAASDWRLSV